MTSSRQAPGKNEHTCFARAHALRFHGLTYSHDIVLQGLNMLDKPHSPEEHLPSTPQRQKDASVTKQDTPEDRQSSIIRSARTQNKSSAPLGSDESRDSAIHECDGNALAKEETGAETGAAHLVQQVEVCSNEPVRSEVTRRVVPQSSAAEAEKANRGSKQKSSLGAHGNNHNSRAREDDRPSKVKQQGSRSHSDGLCGTAAGEKRKRVESLSNHRPSEAHNSLNASELSGKDTAARDASLDDLMDDDDCTQHVSAMSPKHRRSSAEVYMHAPPGIRSTSLWLVRMLINACELLALTWFKSLISCKV
jgi:hypothetical protein